MQPLSQFVRDDEICWDTLTRAAPSTKTQVANLAAVFQKCSERGINPFQSKIVANLDGSTPHFNHGYSLCLTRSRAADSGYWLTWLGRKMLDDEIFMLQGVKPQQLPSSVRKLTSARKLRQLAGNAIPVPLVKCVLKAALQSADLL